VRWNRALESFYGVERDAAIGRYLADIFDAPFVEALRAARQEHPYGATLYRVPLSSRDNDTPRLLVNATEVPLQNASGDDAVVGLLMIIEDITDHVRLEEQLQISEKMASIGLLAAGVAHEVNTPLTGISSFTQMLLDGADPNDPKTVLLEKIERQTFRAAKIVNGLLNLSRPGTASERILVDLNAVIGDVSSLLEHQFEVGKIKVRRELAPSGAMVVGVEHQHETHAFLPFGVIVGPRPGRPHAYPIMATSPMSHDFRGLCHGERWRYRRTSPARLPR